MGCLVAGGMEAAWSEQRQKQLGDVGYYELTRDKLYAPNFCQVCDGKVVKALMSVAITLPLWTYRVIYMRRAVEDIKRSWYRISKYRMPSLDYPENFNRETEWCIAALRERVKTLDVIWYDDMKHDPVAVLSRLNWPINAERAAQHVRR